MPSVLPFWSRAAERAKAQEDQVNQPPTPAPPNNNDRPNPESEAGWLSRLLFLCVAHIARASNILPLLDAVPCKLDCWVDAVLRTGEEACRLRDCLEAEELFALHPSDEATWNFKSFQHAWGEQDQVCKAKGDGVGVSLRSVLYREFRASLWETGALKYINDVAQFVLPLVLLRLLRGLEDPSSPSLTLYGLAVLIFVLTAFRVSIENHYFYKTFRLGAQLGGAVSCKVYHKALALAPSARQTRSSGELVNYMQLDANKLMMFTQSVHVLWSGLHQILGYTAVLYSVISWSALVGVALLVILIPVQGMLQVGLMRYRGQANKETDARIKLTNEILQGIKTIKMYGWEESFAEAMGHIRSLELSQLRKLAMVSAVNTAIFMCTPAFATVITFVVYTAVQGQSFSAAQAFTAVTLFNSLRFPLIFYPAVLAQYAGVKLSLARLDAFFALEEIDPSYFTFAPSSQELQPLDSPSATGAGDGNDGPTSGHKANTAASLSPKSGRRKAQAPEAIQIKDGDFSRTFAPPSSGSPEGSSVSPALTLADVNLTVHKGELVAVVGRVSRGKTTLCASLLGELSKCKGSVMVKGSVAYVPQSPWVFNATLRDNIVFGHVFDEELYERVLSACALTADVKMLRHGDLTEIGERGINLSGGQKQRVAIARAVYSGADVIIMDDPLSALDAHVCKHVFDNCLRGPLLRGRTVLLATNQLQFVAHTDYVIVLANQDGDKGACHIAQQGTYRELMNTTQDGNSSTSGFKALMQDLGLKASSEQDTVDEEEAEPAQAPELPSASKRAPDVLPSMAVSPKPVALVGGKELTKTEAREKGSVPLTTYVTYVRAARSWLLVAVVLGCFAIANAVDKISQWWISYWTEDSSLTRHPLALYLVLFLLLNIAVAVLTSLRTVLFAILGQRSAKNMHTQLTASVLAAPLAWFDSTPTGRVVNRFSADLSTLDEALPTTMAMFLNMLLSLLATIATIAVLLPWVLLGLAPLSFYYASVLRYYNTTNRELKRLDSVSRSPIFSLFAETLQGLASIRAFKKEPFYSHRITSLLDSNRRAYMSMMALQRWLGLRIELIADALILVVSLACIAQRTSLAPALAALALSQATFTTGMLNFVIRMAADTEAQMNSVERVLEFSTKLPQELQTLTATLEPQPDVEQAMTVIVATNQQLPSSWPSEGSICFRDYKMRYREGLDLALKGISLRIEGGEKIGVCGRTGSGKSTVMLALLRLVEGAEGAIEVDGLDIKHVPLKTLRTKVSIIPQEAVLFSGTFRYNLDPFEAYTDDQIWTALDKVHLKATVSALPAKLETRVSEGGENFSLGQRQLVCLARALLRESHILLLDEATASVDYETDVLVQRTVRAEFKHCTVLTIAHRLNTIIDSDKVLVLDGGLVAEFGPPHELVQKDGQGAVFRSLVDETGPDYAATLKNQAQQAYEGYLQRQAQRPHSNDDAEHVSDNHQNHERRRSSCISLVDIPLE